MHDIEQVTREHNFDRSNRRGPAEREDFLEFESEDELEGEDEQFLELEHEDEHFLELEHEDFLSASSEQEDEDETDRSFELEHEDEMAISADAELEFATRFLEVGSGAELEQFIGTLIRAGSQAGDFARSREGRQIAGIVRGAASRVLPMLHRVGGRSVPPDLQPNMNGGRDVAPGSLLRFGRRVLGLELEGLALEDQEFEISRQFIRFASDAIRRCLRRRGTAPARNVAQQAALAAADRFAPGLLTDSVLAAPGLARAVTAPAGPTAEPSPEPISTMVPRSMSRPQSAEGAQHPQNVQNVLNSRGARVAPSTRRGAASSAPPCTHCGSTNAAPSTSPGGRRRQGRWVMQGDTIILLPSPQGTPPRPVSRRPSWGPQ